MEKILVVARWKEDVTWLEHLPNNWGHVIIQKETDVPNIGREPHSFLHFIIKCYDFILPDAVFAFIQGNPFDHCPYLLDALEDDAVWQECNGYVELGSKPHTTDANGSPAHTGLPVGEYYTKWFNKEFPKEGVSFVAGGQFLVTGAAIKARNKAFYEGIFNDILENPDKVPWVLERTWGTIFSPEPESTLQREE